MAERNVTFLILAKDFASRVMKNVGDSTDRTAQKLRDLNVLGLGPLATTAAALGPALLPVMGAAVTGVLALGPAFASAGAAAGVFGAVIGTTFKEVADASKKNADLTDKIRLLNKEISMAPFGTVKQSTLIKSRDKALLEYRARLALLPAPTRAAVMALDSLKMTWKNFVDSVKPGTLSILTRGFNALSQVIPKLRPLFIAGAEAANYLVGAFQRLIDNGTIDRLVNFLATRAMPTFESFGGILLSFAAGVGYLVAPFLSMTDSVVGGLDRISYAFAGWARNEGAAGVRRMIEYTVKNGPAMGKLFFGLAESIGTLAQAAAPLAPISLAVATALTSIINALPQSVLTGLIGGFIAWSVAMRAAMIVTRVGSAVAIFAGIVVGLTTALAGATLAENASTAAKVTYAIVTGIATAAQWAWNAALIVGAGAMAVLTSPITLIVLGIAALAAGVIYAYTHFAFFRNAVDAVGRAFVTAWQWISSTFMAGIRAVPGIIGAIVGFFRALPGRILGAIVALPGLWVAYWRFILERGAYLAGYIVGTIVRFFILLPGRVMGAVRALPGLLSRLWDAVWSRAVSLTVSGSRRIVSFFSALPGRARSAMYRIIGDVASVMTSAWNRGVSIVSSGVSRAVAFFRSLPGKARSAISALPGMIRGVFSGAAGWLLSAGADVVRGLLSGIRSMAGAVVGEARRIGGSIVSGFRNAMHIGSPSRVMANEVGRWIPPGILLGIRSAMPSLLRGVSSSMADVTQAATGSGSFDFTASGSGGRADIGPGLGGSGMTLVLNVNGALDPLAVGRQIVTILERWAASQGKHFELAQ
jgi:hypothetical protein